MGQYRSHVRVFLALISFVSLAPQHLGSNDAVSARDTVSVIESVSPGLPQGVQMDIVGGDTYIRIRSTGHEVTIPGYEGEPYVRISANGRVQVNDASATTVLNGDRYGNVDLSSFTPSATPKWRTIATDGMVMWHDHRVHWMSPQKPAVIDSKGTVLTFDVPFTVDSTEFHAKGALYLRDRASLAWWLLGALALSIALLVILMRTSMFVVPVLCASLLGTVVGYLEYFGMPMGARTNGFLMWCSAGAIALAASSWLLAQSRRITYATGPVLAGAGLTLVVAALVNAHQVGAAYIPGIQNMWMARFAIPTMLGTGIVTTINGVMRAWRPLDT